jgi:hypothetical protein
MSFVIETMSIADATAAVEAGKANTRNTEHSQLFDAIYTAVKTANEEGTAVVVDLLNPKFGLDVDSDGKARKAASIAQPYKTRYDALMALSTSAWMKGRFLLKQGNFAAPPNIVRDEDGKVAFFTFS